MPRKPPPPGPGRPKGSQNKSTVAVKEFAVSVIENPAYQASVLERALAGKLGALEPVLYYYAAGKPKEQVEHSGEVKLPQVIRHVLRPEGE